MLRAVRAALGALALALPLSGFASGCLWFGGEDGLLHIASGRVAAEVKPPGSVQAIAMGAQDCGVWVLGGTHISRFDETGTLRAQVLLAAIDPRLARATHLAVEPSGNTIWLASAQVIARVSATGELLAVAAVDAPVRAIAATAQPGAWVLAHKQLTHHDAAGVRVHADLRGTASGEPKQMAVDPLAGAAWIATNKELIRLPLTGTPSPLVVRVSEAIAGLAVNPLTGTVWLAEGTNLREVDAGGALLRTFPIPVPGVQDPAAIAVDAAARELWVWTPGGVARVTMDGALLGFIPLAQGPGLVAAQPLVLRPVLGLVAPPDGAVTNDAWRSVTLQYGAECNGQPCDPGTAYFSALQLQAALNGTQVGSAFGFDASKREASYTPTQPLPEGTNTLSAQLRDAAGSLSNTVLAQFTVDTVAPPPPTASGITVSAPAAGVVTVTGAAASVESGSTVTLTNPRTGASVVTTATSAGAFTAQVAAAAGDTLTIATVDAAGNAGAAASLAVPGGLPADPRTVATPIDPTVPTRVGASTAFLYTGANPIQQGVAPGTIEPRRAAVLRGRVITREGQALPGVKVTIKDHPEFGHTFSREDGMFDMAVNGGGQVTVQFDKGGLLPVQRTVDTPWGDWVRVPDAALIALDAQATRIDLASGVPQAARSSVVTDANGSRQVTMLFSAGTTASLLMSDGTSSPLPSLNVRATEYTVGPGGERAMPGPLPSTTDYTYAVELSADEAIAAGAKSVVFSQAVAVYVDNFLGFPVGTTVPSGYYDRAKAAWVGSDNGRVVRVLAIDGGMAVLDVNGQGLPATDAHLARLGITEAERVQLAALFAPGKSMWRVPVRHFTPYDFNWLVRRLESPTGCNADGCLGPDTLPDPRTCEAGGCIIETQNQALGEVLPVVGTPYTLNYRSSRTQGYRAPASLRLPLTSAALPELLRSVRMEVSIAGRIIAREFTPAPNVTHRIEWDGKDAYGRTVAGRHAVVVRIGYAYEVPWTITSEFLDMASRLAQAWGSPGEFDGPIGSRQVTSWNTFHTTLDAPLPGTSQHLGGWGFDAHHVYDTERGLLMQGDGRVRDTPVLAVDTYTQPGVGSWIVAPDLATQADGSVLVSGGFGNATTGGLRRIAPTGEVTNLTGTATARSVAHRPGGDIYITAADGIGGRDGIFRVNADGTLTAIAGYPRHALPTDPPDAAIRQLIYPRRIAVDREGNVYFTQQVRRQGTSLVSDCRVRRVNLSGTISDIAGSGLCFDTGGDGGPSLAAGFRPEDIALDDDGNVFFTDGVVVRKVTADGRISTVAGTRSAGDASDGRPAIETWLGVANTPGQQPAVLGVQAVAVDRAGELLISTWNRVLRLGKDGTLRTVMGSTASTCAQAAVPRSAAVGACTRGLGAVAEDPQGRVFVMQDPAGVGDHMLRKVDPALPQAVQGEFFVPSEDGAAVHVFDATGRHLRTLDAKLKATLVAFGYDASGRLLTLRDGDGNETRIEREASGTATAIVSPHGQRNTFAFDANGYLQRLTNPAGETHAMAYTADGLLTTFTNPRGLSSSYQYDERGLLRQDRNAAGGGWDLASGPQPGEVTLTSAEGRATNYRRPNRIERSVLAPDGTETRSSTFDSGDESLVKPNGTRVFTEHGPDPRFGLQVPVEKRTAVTMPSGLAFTQTATRSATTAAGLLDLATQTDTVTVNGRTWTTLFDAPTRTQTSTSPLGRRSIVKLDEKARPVQSSVSGVEPVNYSYDARGRIAGISQGARNTTMGYDALGRLGTVTDALGRSTGYAYDAADRVTRKTLPDGRVVGFGYDANGNLTSITPPSRPVHAFTYTPVDLQDRYDPPPVPGVAMPATRYTYDRDKLLTSVIRPDGLLIGFDRDIAGRVSSVSTPTGTTTFTYSPTTGELTDIAAPGGIALSYAYDGDLLLSEIWSGEVSGSVSRTYDSHFDLQALDVLGTRYSFTYDNDRLLTGVGAMTIGRDAANGFIRSTQLEGVATSQSYNAFGELQSHSATHGGTTLFAQSLAYDNAGRIVGKTEQVSGQTDSFGYGYDLAGRLETVSKNGSQISRYEYDPNGNRTSDGVNTAIYDAQDRLIQYGAATYEYTDNGELKTKRVGSEVTSYEYDVLGNLRKVVLPNGKVIEYLVDGRNRRIGRKVNGVLEYGLIYLNQLNPVAQVDGQGNVIARFIYGTKENVPDFMEKGGRTYRIVTDHLGSVRAVVDVATGEVVQRIEYDAFGQVIQDTSPRFQPFAFAGGLYDPYTALTRFGARDYDALLGRWTAMDPIGFRGGDTNLLSYVTGDPVNYIDLEGLAPDGHHWVIGPIRNDSNLSPDARQVFRDARTGFYGERHGWDKAHSDYNKGVQDLWNSKKLDPSTMTKGQAQDFVRDVMRSSDPRIASYRRHIINQCLTYGMRRGSWTRGGGE